MNSLIARTVKAGTRILMASLLACGLHAQTRPVDPGLTAHEWGTFTSVAGNDGLAVAWFPLNGSTNLPGFVEHFRNPGFKQALRGTVRMETPVLYFYSSHEVTLSVDVGFSKGLITEWYPHVNASALEGEYNDYTVLYDRKTGGAISWDSVTLEPGHAASFPRETSNNEDRYYAARETLATPLRVNTPKGAQYEKFLFYRGVSVFSVPVSAKFTPEGRLRVKNLLKEEIPAVILFERRGEKVGYSTSGGLHNEVVLELPKLTSRIESLYGDLEEALVARGLYREEAHAMLETWRDSWFEEGSRLFYIVPAPFVEAILPLSITPAPAQTVRVFVGRLELVSPATQRAVTAALAAGDKGTLEKYSRFLQPILGIIRGKNAVAGQPQESQDSPCAVDAAPAAGLDKRASRKLASGL